MVLRKRRLKPNTSGLVGHEKGIHGAGCRRDSLRLLNGLHLLGGCASPFLSFLSFFLVRLSGFEGSSVGYLQCVCLMDASYGLGCLAWIWLISRLLLP